MDMKSTVDENQAPAIEFRHVCLSFEDRCVLRDISFRLERGQMIAITGASGSGKSVLLHLAMGLIRPDEGQIFVAGREIEHMSEDELLAIRGGLMGMVFQEDSLFTGLSVYENTAYRLSEHGWKDEDAEPAVREALSFVGLEEDADRLPEELSGGMKRRLEFARAIIGWPEIMLFDEPTQELDPVNGEQILNLILRARDLHNISSLFVTKQLFEIAYLAEHRMTKENDEIVVHEIDEADGTNVLVIMLKEGEIVFNGTPAEFASSTKKDVTYLTHAENGTVISDLYIADPWDKKRRALLTEEILGED